MPQTDLESSNRSPSDQLELPQAYYDNLQSNDINLFELFDIFWSKKIWIASITAVITLLAIVYSYSIPPVYKATAFLLPPQNKDIQGLNVYSSAEVNLLGVYNHEGNAQSISSNSLNQLSYYEPQKVVEYALINLLSREYRWQFFTKNNLADFYVGDQSGNTNAREVFNTVFNDAFEIHFTTRNKKSGDIGDITISFMLTDANKTAEWLNKFVDFINEKTRKDMFDEVRGTGMGAIRKLKLEISRMRESTVLERKDEIRRIKEQLEIAKKLKIHDKKGTTTVIQMGHGKSQGPTYLDGTKLLKLALKSLQDKSDNVYTPDLRKLQSLLNSMENRKIDETNFRSFRVDQYALVPQHPIKPRKRLIVGLAFFAGLFISLVFVFVWHAIGKYRKENKQ